MAPSPVSMYFSKLGDGTHMVKCNLCSKEIKTSGNTTNQRHHLKRHHSTVFQSCQIQGAEQEQQIQTLTVLTSNLEDHIYVAMPVDEANRFRLKYRIKSRIWRRLLAKNQISLHRLQMATLPAKRYRKRSNVWTVFTKSSINAAMCNLCQKEVRTCGNTSNLLSHIKRNHNDVLPDILVGEISSDALDNAVREIQLEPEVTIDENNTNDKPADSQQQTTPKPNQTAKKKSDFNLTKPRGKNSMEMIKLNSTIEKINKSVDSWANTVDAKTSRVLQAAEKSQFYHGFEFLDTQFKKLPELKAQELMQKFMAMTYEAINQHEILNHPVYHVQLMQQDE